MYIGEYELESPLMNGGGVVKSIEDVRQMASTGVGAIVAGSFTLEPRVGNSPNGERVYYHSAESGITYNSLGMPNKGLEVVAEQLPEMIDIAHDAGKPFVLNFAPVSSDPVAEIGIMADVLERAGVTQLDGVELNASCPNVVTKDGGRHEVLSHHPDSLGEALFRLREVGVMQIDIGTRIVRISPFASHGGAISVVKVVSNGGADALTAFNTFTGRAPKNPDGSFILQVPNGAGGMSGLGKSSEAELQMERLQNAQRELRRVHRFEIDQTFAIIGSNGIYNALSMKRRLDMGADAVSASTLFFESPNWRLAVDKLLTEYAELVEA